MNDSNASSFMEKVSGAVAGALSDALEKQSPQLAAANKYRERFLSNNRVKATTRIYISQEMAALITKIASAVGSDKVSVGHYMTEIVREHIERNRDAINAIYLTDTHPLF